MKRFVFKLLPIAGMLVTWGSAHAAVSCTIAATSLTGIAFDPASALQRTGTVSGNCTLTGGDVNNANAFYIGINKGGPTPRSMQNVVTYEINKSAGAGVWNEAPGTIAPSTTAGGVTFALTGNRGNPQPYSYTFYLDIPAQPTDPVGTYTDTLTATIRQGTTAAGLPQYATTTFNLSATISPGCSFSTAAPTLNINYTSFAAAAASGTSVFALNCNVGTSITGVTVLPTTGKTDRNVDYSVAVSPAGTGTGTGTPQNYTVTGTAAAGQAGCTSPCATATPLNNSHTITVSY